MDYYGGSHLHDMPKKKGARLLWENQHSALAEVGCVATEKEFPDGGMSVSLRCNNIPVITYTNIFPELSSMPGSTTR